MESSTDSNLMRFSIYPNTLIIDNSAKAVNLNKSTQLVTTSSNSEYLPLEEHNYNKLKPTVKVRILFIKLGH